MQHANIKLILVLITSLFWSLSASGSTVWKPTDININSFSLDAPPGVSFALLDYDEDSDSVDFTTILLFESGDQISFSNNAGEILATNDTNPLHPTLVLDNTRFFVIGANDGSGWQLDEGMGDRLGMHIFSLLFLFPSNTFTLTLTNATPIGCDPSIVPLPPAALLLSGGLAMLMKVGRKTRQRPPMPITTKAVQA